MKSSIRLTLLAASLALSTSASTCAATTELSERGFDTAFNYVSVPENRADPDTRDINVAYLRMQGASDGVPTFVFFGGPGESATDYGSLESLRGAFGHLLASADVVFIEQRGVGASRPNLDCEPVSFPLDRAVTVEAVIDAHAEILPACVAAAGTDMRGYTTASIADDADAIRQTLGYDRINLSGGSYGAQQAYFYIRRHSEHVNRAVLTQFLVPGTSLAMPSTIDSYVVELGERLGPAFGHPEGGGEVLASLMATVFEAAEETPVEISLGEVSLTAGRTDLEIITSLAMRRTRESWLLPFLFSQMSAGDFGFVGQAMLQFYRQGLPVNAAVIALDCADQTNSLRRARFEEEAASALTGFGSHLPFPGACDAFEHGSVEQQIMTHAGVGGVPTLFIQGELDARARDENLGPLLANSESARLLVIGNATHDLGRSASSTIGARLDAIEAGFLFYGDWPDSNRIDVPLELD